MWIKRTINEHVRDLTKQFPVIYLSGARQVGKTSLLRHLFPEYTYVTFDDPRKAAEAENTPDTFLSDLKRPVIIDEAQYVPGIFRHLKIAVDSEKRKGQFLLTGSQNFTLMQHLTESLAGRCAIVNLQPLSAEELSTAGYLSQPDEFIAKGGYPALYSEQIDSQYYFPSYISTYLERDVRNILNVGNLHTFHLFLRAVAARTGQTLSLTDLSRDISIAPNTVKSWLSVLEASNIIYLLPPYHRNIGKRLIKSPKLYFLDTGLAAHLMGLFSWKEIHKSPMAGALWETYAFNQIYRYLVNRGLHHPFYYWRTQNGQEVDFLVEKGGNFIALEAKLTGNPTVEDLKGFRAFEKLYGEVLLKKVVVCNVTRDYSFTKDARAINGIHPDILEN